MAAKHSRAHQAGRRSGRSAQARFRRTNPGAVERYLKGIDFPARKDDLLEQAHRNDAPGDVLKMIEMLDDKEYQSAVDITVGIGKYD